MLTQKPLSDSIALPFGKLIYLLYTLAHAIVLAWGTTVFITAPSLSLGLLLLVLVGLVYDNLVIFVGDWIQLGDRLESLNKGRYWFHGLFSPLLLVFAIQMIHFVSVRWDQQPYSDLISWALTITLIAIEVLTRMVKLDLKPVTFAGTLRYKEVIPSRELPVILVILLVGTIGVIIWNQAHWPWMFWGSLVMLLGSAVPTTTKAGPSVGSGVEVVFGLSLLLTYLALAIG